MSISTFDIIILGAGPAGSTAVLALRKSGLKVVVIDKASFPRDKICGDSVSSVVKRILRQIDPQLEMDLLDFAPKTNITKATMYSPRLERLQIGFTRVGHCIRRIDFDNWLYQKACNNPDATFMHGVQPTELTASENGIQLTLNNGQQLQAKLLIGCDGAQSFASKKLGGFKLDRKHHSGAVRQYYRNIHGIMPDSLEVYFLKDYLPGYFWIFPLSNNEANVGYGMLSETIANKKVDLKQVMDQIIHHAPGIAERFKLAEALEAPTGFSLPLGSRKVTISGDHFMLCGDAASLIDPFSGEGIDTAMESGKFAAEMAIQCFTANNFSAAFIKQYEARVYKKMWGPFKSHYFLQRLLNNRVWLINLLIRIGNIPWVNKRIPKYFY